MSSEELRETAPRRPSYVGLRAEGKVGASFCVQRRREERMSVEERVRYLLRVANRAEGEGDPWLARLFRRMAEDALPVDRREPRPHLETPASSTS